MLRYSFSTVYMTILTSNLLLVLISCLFLSKKIMANVGCRLLAVFVGLTVIRFLFPFEFPFTTTLIIPEKISYYIMMVRHPLFYIWEYKISIWTFIQFAWLIGIVVKLMLYFRQIRMTHNYILIYGKKSPNQEKYNTILNEICKKHGKENHFRILELPDLNSPMVFGIRNPYILLPDSLSFDEKGMYYVLSHEASHHFRHDILLKCAVHILSIVYWWNPVCYILNKQVALLLEMRVDDTLTNVDDKTTTSEYLNCLLALAEQAQEKKVMQTPLSLSFTQLDKDILTKRFHMLLNRKQPRNHIFNIVLLSTVIFLYALSYFYILEASYDIPEAKETIDLSEVGSYFIQRENGLYDFYLQGMYAETVDNLEYYPDDIPVFTEDEVK